MYSSAHNLLEFALEIWEIKENQTHTCELKPHKSPVLAPVVTKKRSGQSLKPNDKHNIYKFQFVLLHLKNVQFVSGGGFCSLCPRSSLQSSVTDGSLAPECRYPKETGCRKLQGGGINPAWLAFVVYGLLVMSVIKDVLFLLFFLLFF